MPYPGANYAQPHIMRYVAKTISGDVVLPEEIVPVFGHYGFIVPFSPLSETAHVLWHLYWHSQKALIKVVEEEKVVRAALYEIEINSIGPKAIAIFSHIEDIDSASI
jgi:hypothetical protein